MLTWQKNTLLERAHKQAHKQTCVLLNTHLFLPVNSLIESNSNPFVSILESILEAFFEDENVTIVQTNKRTSPSL